MKRLSIALGFCASVFITEAQAASLLTVAEFGSAPTPVAGFIPQISPFPPKVTQQVDFTGGAVQTSALNAQTAYVCANASVRAAIKVETGSSSVATTDWPLAVDSPWCFSVPKGQSYKISVIANP